MSSRLASSMDHYLQQLLMRDEALISSAPAMLNESAQHLPVTFDFPFQDMDNTHAAGSTASACSNIMQAMKRPLFWPFLDVERVKGSLSPDQNVVNEQSASPSEFYTVSNTSMMERMPQAKEYSNEEMDMNMNEGDSRVRKKKRLTGEQVRALEGSFEADKKLEAQRKQELAQRLGLEQRQVAVWFQNRRARSKTKHLEHDFALMKSKYHYVLAETHKLRSEVSRLTAELEATKGEGAGLGAKPSCTAIQSAPIAPFQNSASNQLYGGTKDDKSTNINFMEAAHVVHEGTNVLSKSERNYNIVINGKMKQNISSSGSASPASRSCSPENSAQENLGEGRLSSDCNSEEDGQQYIEEAHCGELQLPAACLEHVDTNYYNSFQAAHLKKVDDDHIHIFQAASHHLSQLSSDDCLQYPSSGLHHHVALDCLWELAT